jgi:hypothetical protein
MKSGKEVEKTGGSINEVLNSLAQFNMGKIDKECKYSYDIINKYICIRIR